LNGRRGLEPPRQVLLGCRAIDQPRLAVEILLDAGSFGDVVILDADEPPLQSGKPIVGRHRQLSIHGWL
jgi:hypothetical protein